MKLSIIIPSYNEAPSITSTLAELEEYLKNFMPEGGWEVIVVDDGSSDSTPELLEEARKKYCWLKVLPLGVHYGRGKALREGLAHSEGEIIISLDADLSYAPYHIERLVRKMNEEKADLVLASAYGPGGTVKNVPFFRLLLSRLGNIILSFMFGGNITVLTCLVRAYRRSFINRLDLHSTDKDIHLEILYKAKILNARIAEVPADLCWRESKFKKPGQTGKPARRSTLKLRMTGYSHLFFALMSRPGFIFWIPGYILIGISLIIMLMTASFIAGTVMGGQTLYNAIRNSMLNGAPTWFTMSLSFILGIQFLTLGFITNQNKKNYEETYKTQSEILNELRKLRKS